jgi:hypothetical protein
MLRLGEGVTYLTEKNVLRIWKTRPYPPRECWCGCPQSPPCEASEWMRRGNRVKMRVKKNMRVVEVITVVVALFGVSSWCYTPASFAADSEVIDGIEEDIVSTICADDGEWLKCYNKPPAQCESYAKAIVRPCLEQEIGSVRGPIPLSAALQYAVESKSCFNKAIPDVLGEAVKSEDCTNKRPGHLW